MIEAYFLIQSDLGGAAVVARLVQTVPGVSETEIVTGPYDVVARVQAHDMDELARQVASQIQALTGVMWTATCIIREPQAAASPPHLGGRGGNRQHRWATNGSPAKLGRGVSTPYTPV